MRQEATTLCKVSVSCTKVSLLGAPGSMGLVFFLFPIEMDGWVRPRGLHVISPLSALTSRLWFLFSYPWPGFQAYLQAMYHTILLNNETIEEKY